MRRLALGSAMFALCALVAGCGGDSGGGPTSPGGSGGSGGPWTGTITRPGGLGDIAVRWETTTTAEGFAGPMTLTIGGSSITLTARGNTAGNDRQGYTLHLSFSSNTGDFAAFPNCSVRGNSAGAQAGDPFPSPYTAITVPTFNISYSGCRGFIDTGYSSTLSNFIQENAQVSLRK